MGVGLEVAVRGSVMRLRGPREMLAVRQVWEMRKGPDPEKALPVS